MAKRFFLSLGFLLVLGGIIYVAGPSPNYADFDGNISLLDQTIASIQSYVENKESNISQLKPDNEARIIWADSTQSKTPYSIVYLHGFSASQEEGDPIHTELAQRYGCNLFLSRLADHGRLDSNTFINLTPGDLVESAKEAIAIGKILGDEVIVMSCSTGSTLSAYLAAENPNMIHSQIMYSPNIDIADPMSDMLDLPWGYQIAKLSFGSEYNKIEYPDKQRKYWNDVYHVKGLIALKSLIKNTMVKENFQKIKQPLFIGYYYKDEENQDRVVSVPRMHDFFAQVKTPDNKKRMVPFPNAGRHVIASHVLSADVESVKTETIKFMEEILGISQMNN